MARSANKVGPVLIEGLVVPRKSKGLSYFTARYRVAPVVLFILKSGAGGCRAVPPLKLCGARSVTIVRRYLRQEWDLRWRDNVNYSGIGI
uniref:Uncharacterized protein n=1 Tax=Romanomermis culicivorax TaxID=13658 RepID=A0A915HXY6_ROMCU